MTPSIKKRIAGSYLLIQERDNKKFHFYRWEANEIACLEKRGRRFVLTPSIFLEYCDDFDSSGISGTFGTIDEAHNFVIQYLTTREDFQLFLKQKHKEQKEYFHEFRKYLKDEEAKEYHLELANLTAEHNLYYSDLVSSRVKHILREAEVYTLADLCHLKRSEFLKYRMCGEKTAKEVDMLLHQVGLDWDTPNLQSEIDLSAVSDEALVAECRRRNLKY